MRKVIGCFIACLCIIGFLSVCTMSVRAEEAYPADLSDFFKIAYTRSDVPAEGDSFYLGQFFFDDPVGFIRALATEDEAVHDRVIHHFCGAMFHGMYTNSTNKFPDAVNSIVLTEDDTDMTRYILNVFQEKVLEFWRIPPNNDWSGVDWENYSYDNLHRTAWESMCNWLHENGECEAILTVYFHTDGWVSELFYPVLHDCFLETPLTFIRILAKEELSEQILITKNVVATGYSNRDPAVPLLLSWLDENELETERERDVLQLMRDSVAAYWGDEIPHTGDPVVFMAAGLVLSGLGGVLLLNKKKKEI